MEKDTKNLLERLYGLFGKQLPRGRFLEQHTSELKQQDPTTAGIAETNPRFLKQLAQQMGLAGAGHSISAEILSY